MDNKNDIIEGQADQHSMIDEKSTDEKSVEHSTVEHSTVEHSTVEHSTVEHSTVEHSSTNINARMELITRDLAETIAMDEVQAKLIDNDKTLRCYWGTEPTRSPSLGYLIPMIKLRDLINASVDVVVLIADVHAHLNKGISEIDRTDERVTYYTFLIKLLLERLSVDVNKVDFVRGKAIQLDPSYTMDLYKLMTKVSVTQAKKSGSEVVKKNENPKVSSLVYPLMQVLDEQFLEADIQLGGLDQRKIFALSRDVSDRKCAYLMNNLLPSLGKPGTKMSASDAMGKIDFYDSRSMIQEKIKRTYCSEGVIHLESSPCLALCKYIIFPILGKLGNYNSYTTLTEDWADRKLYSDELKELIIDALDEIIDPIRTAIIANWNLYGAAYL